MASKIPRNSRPAESQFKTSKTAHASNAAFEALFSRHPQPALIFEVPSLRIRDANASAIALLLYPREQITTMRLLDLIETGQLADLRKFLETDTRKERITGPWHFRRKDGGTVSVETASNLIEHDGRPARFVVMRDVTERVQAERKLREAQESLREKQARLQLLIEHLPAMLWTTDRDLHCTSAMGSSRHNPLPGAGAGRTIEQGLGIAQPDSPAAVVHRGALAGEAGGYQWAVADRMFQCHVEPLPGEDGGVAGTIGMALDVTERKDLEGQLLQAQKMEAVGKLAGGIAHDFNNLLMVIQGYSDLLLEKIPAGDAAYRPCQQIRTASDRAIALTRQLLTLSRKHVPATTLLDLNAVVADVDRMLRRLIGEDVEILTRGPEELWTVKADRGQIEQVIFSLAVNSRDAMPHGGKLTIETANVEIGAAGSPHPPETRPGRYVMLAVTDTGCGMTPEIRARVFEPFFTTKPSGTGLGLSTVFAVVKQYDGFLEVESEPGRGAAFRAYFPRHAPGAESAETAAEEAPPTGHETVLLVEDEEGVRNLARQFLERGGYTVLEAANGKEALRLVRDFAGPIQLLMTDVVMPEISGSELAARLVRIRPGLKVLYMSGYTGETIVHHGVPEPGVTLLQKPFDRGKLWRKVRETLDCPGDCEAVPQAQS